MTQASQPWCRGSAPCRIDWRPSRCLLAALPLMGVLASTATAWLLALAALAQGAWLAWREWRRPRRSLLFTADGRLMVDDADVDDVRLQWRGPLAFLAWRSADGALGRLVWWPDTLPPRWRRELRLAVGRLPAARTGPSVAP